MVLESLLHPPERSDARIGPGTWQNQGVSQLQWFDRSQPQTLQAAVMLSYLTAALGVLFGLFFGSWPSLILIALAVAAYGVANDRRLGYRAAVVVAALYLLVQLLFFVVVHSFGGLLNLVFAGVLMALLLHRESRAYQKIWFH